MPTLQSHLLDLFLSMAELLQDNGFRSSELEECGIDWDLLLHLREAEQQLRDRTGGMGVGHQNNPTPN